MATPGRAAQVAQEIEENDCETLLAEAERQRDDLLVACEAGSLLLERLRWDGVISPLYALPAPVRHQYQETEARLRSAISRAKDA